MKWRRWVLVGALIVVGVVIVSLVNYRSEPRYKGRSLSQWLRIYHHHPGWRSDEAFIAVRQIGTNAIPILLADLLYETPAWKVKISRMLARGPRLARRCSGWLVREDDRKSRAETGFRILGPYGAPAIPELIDQLDRHGFEPACVMALVDIGPAAVLPLTEAFTNRANSVGLRSAAALTLMKMRMKASDSVLALLSCANDQDNVISECAILALGSVAQDAEMVIPALTNALAAPRRELRVAAIRSLVNLGERAASAVPQMRVALTDDDARVREFATNGLRRLFPDEFPGFQ